MRRFEEIKTIGDGAFGIVTKCKDKETGEFVAIKKMKQKFHNFDECLQLKEVKSLRRLKHENIVKLLQIFKDNDYLYLVFELLDSSLLNTLNSREKPFSEPEIRYIITHLLKGLVHIHKQGFFHRDLKPDNLLWDKNGYLKIADFGLAREIRSRPPFTEYISTRWYRAPEIILRHEFYNSPVDLWAVGAIMAELYNNKPLFPGTSEIDQLIKIFNIIGTSTLQNWTDSSKLLTKTNIKLQFTPQIPLNQIIPNASLEAIDLMNQLFKLDPSQRPSASQALNHSFFNGELISPIQIEKNNSLLISNILSTNSHSSFIKPKIESDSLISSEIKIPSSEKNKKIPNISETPKIHNEKKNIYFNTKPNFTPNRFNNNNNSKLLPGFLPKPIQNNLNQFNLKFIEGTKSAKPEYNIDEIDEFLKNYIIE